MRTREIKPDEPDSAGSQHPGHHPQTRLVVFSFHTHFEQLSSNQRISFNQRFPCNQGDTSCNP
jgi:hypothetical protein